MACSNFPAQETNERLERLQTAVDQLQRAGHTCYTMTGSFHSPAHNCSHIAQEHPNATSGICAFVNTECTLQGAVILQWWQVYICGSNDCC